MYKHTHTSAVPIDPPQNLPLAPEGPPNQDEGGMADDCSSGTFPDPGPGDTMQSVPAPQPHKHAVGAPACRSLQLEPIRVSMTEPKKHHDKVPTTLLCVDDVAEWLRVSRASVLHLVHRRRLPFYRLHSGIRFRTEDVEAYLTERRTIARVPQPYGHSQD